MFKSSKCQKLNTYTVGTYSEGNSFVVYVISIHVLPTVPSPIVVTLIGLCLETVFLFSEK